MASLEATGLFITLEPASNPNNDSGWNPGGKIWGVYLPYY